MTPSNIDSLTRSIYLSPHSEFITNRLPDWAFELPATTLHGLKQAQPNLHPLLKNITPTENSAFKKILNERWNAHNNVETSLSSILNIYAFAEPLLKQQIKATYHLDIDVNDVFINLHTPTFLPVIALQDNSASSTWRVSLLDAALHNFELYEAEPSAHLPHSGYISRPDARQHFKLRDDIAQKMPLSGFIVLCRTLNLGDRYNAHLKEHLGLHDRGKQLRLKEAIRKSQIADLSAELSYTALTQQLSAGIQQSLTSYVAGLNGEWQTSTLTLGSVKLDSLLVFTPKHQRFIVVYTPHDPVQPIKEYSSIGRYLEHLTVRLKDRTYQHFISRFVEHDQLDKFFSALKHTYYQVITDQPNSPGFAQGDFGVTERLIPITKPSLDYSLSEIKGELWDALFSRKITRLFNDAKSIAVSTGAEDRKTREERWERWKRIGQALFNAATFVIAPFVPVVGELMLLQMAYQLLDDTYEGIHDWVEGKSVEAFDHLFAVLESGIQAGIFAAGASVAGGLLAKSSHFVDGMKPVACTDGTTRLWNPDISAYAHDLNVPAETLPDEVGRYRHNDQTLIKLSGQSGADYTCVINETEHPQQYSLQHPTRAHAYAPKVQHNGEGAWLMEGELPQTWQGSTLMKRLGPISEGFSDTELEELRAISATDEAVLRRVHMNNEPVPPLLKDTLTRVNLHKTIARNIEHVRNGQAITVQGNWLESMPTRLPGWPKSKALNIYADETLSGTPHTYGKTDALPEDTIKLSEADVRQGRLLPRIVEHLNQPQRDALLGADTPSAEAVQRLQEKVADHATSCREDIFKYVYTHQGQSPLPQARLIESTFNELPAPATQVLLDTATPDETAVLLTKSKIPLRLKKLAGEMESQSRITRAREGLHDDHLLSADAERIAINTLRIHTDVVSDLKIEIRDMSVDGPLRFAHTPEGSTTTRVLVRLGPGKYEVYDGDKKLLAAASPFRRALINALPERNLNNLDSHIYPGQSFKQWLAEKYSSSADIRTALDLPTSSSAVRHEAQTLLRGIGNSRVAPAPEINPLVERVKTLYPTRDAAEIETIAGRISTRQALLDLIDAEEEHARLFQELDDWVFNLDFRQVKGMNVRSIKDARSTISHKIKDSWLLADKPRINKSGNVETTVTLDFHNIPLGVIGTDGLKLSSPLKHVTTLLLSNCKLSPGNDAFLSLFPNVTSLSLTSNALQSLPRALKHMPRLERLSLARNQLMINSEARDLLNSMNRLSYLDLSSNPLGTPVDVSQMPDLKTLLLKDAHITQWPEGLFAHQRPDSFYLNLLGNEITSVPECTTPSAQSWLVANTRLERQKLDLVSQERIVQYRRAHGLDPHRTYPPRGEKGSEFWMEGTAQERSLLQASWDDLENEHGSQGFFEVIARMEVHPDSFQTQADRIAYQEGWKDLGTKVWRLIDAANNDTAMRDTLFTMASAPTNCADAGAQIFNAMGLETMVYEAYEANSSPQVLEKHLITLARGKARLNKIYDIARADVAQRIKPVSQGGLGLRFSSDVIDGIPGTVDEVEVHTGYQVRLSDSLELPWVPNYMVYRNTAGVSNEAFVSAYRLIKEGEQGDGLINQILEVPFWEKWLAHACSGELEINATRFDERVEALEQLKALQENWVNSNSALESRDPELATELRARAGELNMAETDVFTQSPLSDSAYYRAYARIGDQRKDVLRELTRQVITRSRLI